MEVDERYQGHLMKREEKGASLQEELSGIFLFQEPRKLKFPRSLCLSFPDWRLSHMECSH
jgi:hypothetical protein